MLLFFRIFRNCVTKNPSNSYTIGKTDRNEILTYLRNFTTFYTDHGKLTQSKNHVRGIECTKSTWLFNFLHKYCQIERKYFDINNLTRDNKIDETSDGDLMGKSLSRRRRRRTKLCGKKVVKSAKKRSPRKKRASKKKMTNNFWLNYQAGSPFLSPHNSVFNSVQHFENANQNHQLVSQFPPLNPNPVFNYVSSSTEVNCFQFSHEESKSYSDVVKTDNLLHSEGNNYYGMVNFSGVSWVIFF